jgi:hypothetical protein
MQTNFFETIASLQVTGDLKIHIQQQKDGQLLVSVLLVNDNVDDEARKMIPPMNFKGTAKPVQQTSALFTNMQDFAEALEKTKEQSKMEKEKEGAEKKQLDERKKKYDAQIKKVNELEEKKKYGEAIGAMPKTTDFPEQAEDIKIKLDELKSKHGQLELL